MSQQWNNTFVDYPLDVCLHEHIRERCLQSPNQEAVMFEGASLTYAQLNRRSDQLAAHLRGLGVRQNVLVAICAERSLELVVALLGVLKAGGAYVPVDPEYPEDRIRFMIRDAAAPIVLTQKKLREVLPSTEAQVICLDDEAAWESKPSPADAVDVGRRDLAYVIYTSGSTGRPKGAMNRHEGICNRLLWMKDQYAVSPSDRILQKTPFSFDVSVWEFFLPLMSGATLVLARPGGHRDSAYLIELIARENITMMHFVPSMLQVFLRAPDVERCVSLRHVVCSGEALSAVARDRFFERLGAQLHNLYGPTEAAVDVTFWDCANDRSGSVIPIGKPVANTQIHILDSALQPVEEGQEGELHIGGVQVGAGYLNRDQLTAERFVSDPFSSDPDAKLYRTGDLARIRKDGNVLFLGRLDHQVKIRGFRIELEEIEVVLGRHDQVAEAAVLAKDAGDGNARLVAYIVQSPGAELTVSGLANALRAHAAAHLPDYMIPGAFVRLESMPLSANGKLDRKLLPEPSNDRPDLEYPYVPPESPLQKYLAELWADAIGVKQIGLNDRFFELGGDSIQAANFVNRLQEELGEFVYVVTVFQAPTIGEYAAMLEKSYTAAVNRKFGSSRPVAQERREIEGRTVDAAMVDRLQASVPVLRAGAETEDDVSNGPAVFILAPPRSGTTLLRVMLAGHPALFSASELQLLGFHTLQERKDAYVGRFSPWLEGTVRAVMELKGCDADEAKRLMAACEAEDMTTKAFFGKLQRSADGRLVVDKSPSYALDPAAMRKAEADFDQAIFVHLVRHPVAMVASFVKQHMDQILYLDEHPFTCRQLGELVWTLSHQNILDFLSTIPPERQHRIGFEDLVREPEPVMQSLCTTFGVDFHTGIIQPYENQDKKMTDGIYPMSTPMGDVRFLKHGHIDPSRADAGKQAQLDEELGAVTWSLAGRLGYEPPARDRNSSRKARLRRMRQGRRGTPA